MPNFATVEDLATYPPARDLSAADTATAAQILDVVTAEIKAYTGQILEAQSGVVDKFRGANNRILLLSQIPVRGTATVTVDGLAFIDFDLNAKAGIITRNDSDWLSWYANESIVVTYDAGYDPIDPAIKGVCLSYAARLMSGPTAGVTAEAIGGYSASYSSGPGFTGLDDVERIVLDRFRAK